MLSKPLIRLFKILAEIYPDTASSTLLMDAAGIRLDRIFAEQGAGTRWYFVVREAEKAGQIPALLAAALADYPDNAELLGIRVELGLNASAATLPFPLQGLALPVPLPLLIAAIGSDTALSLDLASLRAMRVVTGMEFARIQDATLEKLKVALDRERAAGRTANVHLAVHSGPAGVQMGGQVIDAVALSAILDGVQVLLIAGCQSDQIGDFLGVVPSVVSFSEDVSHIDASMFTRLFWVGIGKRLTPPEALYEALHRAPSGLAEYVVKSW